MSTKKTTKKTETSPSTESWAPVSKLELQRAADEERGAKGLEPVLCAACGGEGRSVKEGPKRQPKPGEGPEPGLEETVCEVCKGMGRKDS